MSVPPSCHPTPPPSRQCKVRHRLHGLVERLDLLAVALPDGRCRGIRRAAARRRALVRRNRRPGHPRRRPEVGSSDYFSRKDVLASPRKRVTVTYTHTAVEPELGPRLRAVHERPRAGCLREGPHRRRAVHVAGPDKETVCRVHLHAPWFSLSGSVFKENAVCVVCTLLPGSAASGHRPHHFPPPVGVSQVWPGPTHFPDWFHPNTSAWWAGSLDDFLSSGVAVDGLW